MQKILNLKIKYRESFRPFAPSILREDVNDWFEMKTDSPYMLFVSEVKETKTLMKDNKIMKFGFDRLNETLSSVPAITHVDYSARVQTVDRETNKYFYMLLKKFKEKTDCPILINTSFNVRGEPIVMSPKEAFKCFMGTELDVLVCGNYILYKEDQNTQTISDYKDLYELD
jgi:carbamoyltransferase